MTPELEDKLYDLSDESIEIYKSLEELCLSIFNNEDFLEDSIAWYKNEYDIEELKYNNLIGNNIYKSIDFLEGSMYYSKTYIKDTNNISYENHVYTNEDLLYLIDEFIQTVEEPIINIWEENFKKDENESFYGNVSVDLIIYYYDYMKNIESLKFRPYDMNIKNLYFKLITSNNKIYFKNKSYFTKNKLLYTHNKNYYVLNNIKRNGIISMAIYIREYE